MHSPISAANFTNSSSPAQSKPICPKTKKIQPLETSPRKPTKLELAKSDWKKNAPSRTPRISPIYADVDIEDFKLDDFINGKPSEEDAKLTEKIRHISLREFQSKYEDALYISHDHIFGFKSHKLATRGVCKGVAVAANAVKDGQIVLSGLAVFPKIKTISQPLSIFLAAFQRRTPGAKIDLYVVGGAHSLVTNHAASKKIKQALEAKEFANCVHIKHQDLNPWRIHPRVSKKTVNEDIKTRQIGLSVVMHQGILTVADESLLPKSPHSPFGIHFKPVRKTTSRTNLEASQPDSEPHSSEPHSSEPSKEF